MASTSTDETQIGAWLILEWRCAYPDSKPMDMEKEVADASKCQKWNKPPYLIRDE